MFDLAAFESLSLIADEAFQTSIRAAYRAGYLNSGADDETARGHALSPQGAHALEQSRREAGETRDAALTALRNLREYIGRYLSSAVLQLPLELGKEQMEELEALVAKQFQEDPPLLSPRIPPVARPRT